MKTKEELTALKSEVEALNKKLAELTEDELSQVTGGYEDWRIHNGVDILQTTKPEQAFVNPVDEQMLSVTGGAILPAHVHRLGLEDSDYDIAYKKDGVEVEDLTKPGDYTAVVT